MAHVLTWISQFNDKLIVRIRASPHFPPAAVLQARQTFSVSFYLVSIMYLLFDIEIAYLFPYAMSHASLPMYWTMNMFLAILVAGFAYEWGMGALEWRE